MAQLIAAVLLSHEIYRNVTTKRAKELYLGGWLTSATCWSATATVQFAPQKSVLAKPLKLLRSSWCIGFIFLLL